MAAKKGTKQNRLLQPDPYVKVAHIEPAPVRQEPPQDPHTQPARRAYSVSAPIPAQWPPDPYVKVAHIEPAPVRQESPAGSPHPTRT